MKTSNRNINILLEYLYLLVGVKYMDKEGVSFWNGVHKGLLLAAGAVAGIEGKDELAAIQAIRAYIDKVEDKQLASLRSILGE